MEPVQEDSVALQPGLVTCPTTDHSKQYRDRVSHVSEQMCNLHEGLDGDRNARFNHLTGKMRQLDDRVSASHDHTCKRFDTVKDGVLALEKDVKIEREWHKNLIRQQHDDVVKSDTDLQASIVREQRARRDAEVRILGLFESKTNMIRDECGKVGNIRRDNESSLRRYLEVDVPRLYESLKEEAVHRDAMEDRMIKKTMEEVTHLQGLIVDEKKAREDTEEAMLRMMEDVVTKMQNEIAHERQERIKTEDMLMGLLQATCNKLMAASDAL